MTVAATPLPIVYDENGATLSFAAPFRYNDPADLTVERIAADGTVTPLTYGAAWSATSGSTDAGGTVTLTVAGAAGNRLRINRVTPRAQATDYTTGDRFPAASHEEALDRAMLIDQEQDAAIEDVADRALLAPIGSPGGVLPVLRAGGYLAFDAEGAPILANGTGADAALRTDLAATTGARLIGTRQGLSVQSALDALGAGSKCAIIVNTGQSLRVPRAPKVSTSVPPNFYMPVGGPNWEAMTAPAPLSPSSRGIVPSNFASFVPYAGAAGVEGQLPGMAWKFWRAGYAKIIGWDAGLGGTTLSLHLAGGGTQANTSPLFANVAAYLLDAVAWARGQGLVPEIFWAFEQGHTNAAALNDGGTASPVTTQPEYFAGLGKYYRDADQAVSQALGQRWGGTVWIAPLITGTGGSAPFTLAGRTAVAAAQLQAGKGGVPGIRLLSSWAQFATYFTENDLVHPNGGGFRLKGEADALAMLNPQITVPYIVSTAVTSATQITAIADQAIAIDGTLPETTTAGVKAGFEAYTGVPAQIPLTAAATAGSTLILTVASTAGFAKLRTGLMQETIGAATKMPRVNVRGVTPYGIAEDGTVLWPFLAPGEY